MPVQFDAAILEAVHRASKRSAAIAHEDLKAGVYDLATVASIAPWFGIFGTIVGIVDAFRGIGSERLSAEAAIYGGLSWAMCFTALGLAVGLMALWTYEYLSARLRTLDLEMESASLDLLNQLTRFPRRFEAGAVTGQEVAGPMFGELPPSVALQEEKFFRRCYSLAGVTLALAWFVQASRYFFEDSSCLSCSLRNACFGAGITFLISCFVLYPIWSNLLRRRPGALVAAGSILSLCWSVAEFLLRRPLP
jgi:hypothetical protein